MKRLHKKNLELRPGCHVEGLFQKTLRVSQLIGLAPVRFVSSRTLTFVVISRPWYIYGMILIITLNCILLYDLITILQNQWDYFLKEGFLDIIILFLKYTMTSFFVSICVSNGIKNMNLFMSIIHRIRKIKADIGAHEVPVSKIWRAWFPISCIVTNFLFVLIYYTWIFPGDISYGYYPFIVEYHLMMILILLFLIIACYINTALEEVNNKLRDLMTLMNDGLNILFIAIILYYTMENDCEMPVRVQLPIYSINIAIDTLGLAKLSFADKKNTIRLKMADRLRFLCQIFVATCDILREYNTNMNLIFIIFYSFFTVNFSHRLYLTMKYLQFNNLKTRQYLDIIAVSIKLIVNIFEAILFVEPFYRAKVEISRMRSTVCRMMSLVSSSDPMLDELDVFFKQLLLNDFSYTASGFFALERRLTYTIIGVIVTVLSIFQEFTNFDENKRP